jgi:hypothetical protein
LQVPFRPFLGKVKRALVPPRPIAAEALRRGLFRYGFLCHATADAPSGGHPDWRMVRETWRRTAIGDLTLYAHPEAEVVRYTDGGRETLILGRVFFAVPTDAGDPLSLLAAAGADEIPAALDRLSGRFALITVRDGGTRFWHDPFASRTIFYRDGGAFGVASHDELLALAFGHRRRPEMLEFVRSPWFTTTPMAHLPGDGTLFAGLRILPANHAYDVTTRRPERYWPTRPRRRGSADAFADAMDTWFAALAAGLAGRRPVVSITGGIDSRMVIAGLRRHHVTPRTVTWTSFNFRDWEQEPVDAIVSYLDGRHDRVDATNDGINDAARIGVRNSGNYRSASQVTAGMSRLYGDDHAAVFVRGHGSGPVRGCYQTPPRRFRPIVDLSPGELVRPYFGENYRNPPDKSVIALVEREIGRFAEVVKHKAIAGLGYDPNDIHYWEHKASNWMGAGFNAVDPALDSLLGFNSRPLAEAAYGLPDEVRFEKSVFHDVIHSYDPGLAAISYK